MVIKENNYTKFNHIYKNSGAPLYLINKAEYSLIVDKNTFLTAMITKNVIKNIYKQFKSRPASVDDLNLPLLFEHALVNHGLYVDDGNLVIESAGEGSPFSMIPLDRVHGICEFEKAVAIVLPNAIIFLNKHDDGVNVHLKPADMSLIDRVREIINPETHPDFDF